MTDGPQRDLLDERMDARLQEHGERWRRTLPDATVPPPVESQRRSRGATFAAVAVLVLVGGVLATTQLGDREPRGATTDPTTTLLPQACATGDLVKGGNLFSTTRGTVNLTAVLELAPGGEPCTVAGFPDVVIHAGSIDVETVADPGLGQPGELLVLPDRPVQVTLTWTPAHYCPPYLVTTAIRIRVGDEVGVAFDGFGPTRCRPGDGRPPVHVGPYTHVEPADRFGTVTGVVTRESGEPVTTGTISFEDDSAGDGATIEPDGSYELGLPTGEYDVTVSTPRFNDGRYAAGTFEVVGGETNEIHIVIPVDRRD